MNQSTLTPHAGTIAPPAAPGDQLLVTIFTQEQGSQDPVPDPQAIGDANKQIVAATYGLQVPAITEQQEQELSGNGGPDLRPASVAYQALLEKRPHLGDAKGITPQRFQQVIDKDRAYDALVATTTAVQQATTGTTARAEAQVTSDVVTVAAYVGPRTDPADFTDNENITLHFAPVQTQLQRVETQAHSRDQRQASQARSVAANLTGHLQQQTALPQLGRLTEAAGNKIDLLADPATLPATPAGSHTGTHQSAGTPAKPRKAPAKPKKAPAKPPGQKPPKTPVHKPAGTGAATALKSTPKA